MNLVKVIEDRKSWGEYLHECRKLRRIGVFTDYKDIDFEYARKKFAPESKVRLTLSYVRGKIAFHKGIISDIMNSDSYWCDEARVDQCDFHYNRIHEFEELEADMMKMLS